MGGRLQCCGQGWKVRLRTPEHASKLAEGCVPECQSRPPIPALESFQNLASSNPLDVRHNDSWKPEQIWIAVKYCPLDALSSVLLRVNCGGVARRKTRLSSSDWNEQYSYRSPSLLGPPEINPGFCTGRKRDGGCRHNRGVAGPSLASSSGQRTANDTNAGPVVPAPPAREKPRVPLLLHLSVHSDAQSCRVQRDGDRCPN